PAHTFDGPFDVVLLDGPHGYPFPDLEYYYFYPHVKPGGLLLIDDIQIPTIRALYEFVREDEMFELLEIVEYTAFFRRTPAPLFTRALDGWWPQRFHARGETPPKPRPALLARTKARTPPVLHRLLERIIY